MAELDRRKKILLLLVGSSDKRIDPIRVMKGAFLISEEVPESWWSIGKRYEFVPYQFGPCSFEIYSDLDELEKFRLIQSEQVPGKSWKYYTITDRGKKLLQVTSEGLNPGLLLYVRQIRDFVDSLGLRDLLAAIYKRYPKYAAKSVFQF
jgi:hypothetical protein